MPFSSEFIKHGHVLVIVLQGRIASPDEVLQVLEIKESSELNNFNRVVLDCTDLNYMVSSGLNLMVRILTKSRIHGGDTVLCGLNETLLNVFNVTKLDNIFKVFDTQAEAIKFLNTKDE